RTRTNANGRSVGESIVEMRNTMSSNGDCEGRNLLNKKEAPPSTIKESSESSQTIDEQDGDKVGKTLNHENTVVRVDTSAKAQAQVQQKAQSGSNTSSPRPTAL
uniref:Calcium/calmodulin-dependent protein kinase II association-domain domain-containing protein n=1 Tax=Parascaris univalens TaxID=6257 RepID=A0A915A9F4_PARUN